MKKAARILVFTLSIAILSGVAPKAAYCAMTQKSAAACAMPCCQSTPAKAASCPFISQVPVQDGIALGSIQLSFNVNVVGYWLFRDGELSADPHFSIQRQPVIPKSAAYITPQSIPAPPVLA